MEVFKLNLPFLFSQKQWPVQSNLSLGDWYGLLCCSACVQHQTFPEETNTWNCHFTLAFVLTACIAFCTAKQHTASGIARETSVDTWMLQTSKNVG